MSLSAMANATLPSESMFRATPKIQLASMTLKPPSFLGSVKWVSKAFGLKSSRSSRISAMATYKIKLIGPEGENQEFEAPDDAYILESAENAGIDLPYSCRAGSCCTCAGKLESGSVDQSEGSFLDEDQMKAGYLLTCISYPKSDCVIHTHKEEEIV